MKLFFRLILLSLALIVLSGFQSCTLKQTLNIDKEASGDISFELTLAPFFVEVVE